MRCYELFIIDSSDFVAGLLSCIKLKNTNASIITNFYVKFLYFDRNLILNETG